MTLTPGSKLGPYEVLEPLGAGGMVEVFRAHDPRLDRDVALQVLCEPFKLDPQRLARFTREARVLASLNHPNIGTLHEVATHGDTHALVLELVEGETLAARIASGPLPVPEALAIAQQIAAALEAAHEHGVVHRDLKPANIKVRLDGNVKLLDFGLAKVFATENPGADPIAATATALDIAAGAVLGTPAYMSPEQARGLPVDKRTDIWAFGCVLYEMLAGERPFVGDRPSDVVARIIEREPDFAALPPSTPRGVHRLLHRCLEKDPRKRLRDIGDARFELASTSNDDGSAWIRPGSRGRRIAVTATIAAATAATVAVLGWAVLTPDSANSRNPATQAPITRFTIPAAVLFSPSSRSLAVSADGTRLAYVAEQGLYVRARDQLEATRVEGEPSAGSPFFSPDGEWLGYSDGFQVLKRVPTGGGTPVAIAETGHATHASWTADGLVFASMQGLFRVPAEGDRPEPLPLALEPLEQAVLPQLLPGGRALIFTIIPTRALLPASMANAPGARVEALTLATGERRTLIRGGGRAHYSPTGHLLYAAGETLYAVAFDAERLEVRGNPVPVLDSADFALSDEGTLAYLAGARAGNTLVWVDRTGQEEPIGAPPMAFIYPRLSPDGTRVALDVEGPPSRDIWIWDLRRKALERFTLDPAGNPLVVWSNDGRRLVFGSERYGVSNLFEQAADGDGEPRRLLESERVQMPVSFAPDGRLLFSADVAGRGRDVLALSMDGTGVVEPVIHSAGNDLWAEVSPDGRWIAYDSDESGQFEVYVRPYPDTDGGGRWQISSGGGRQPLWSRDGTELFFRDFTGAMRAASVAATAQFDAGPAVVLFANAGYSGGGGGGSGRTYDLSLDGSRFLMIKAQRGAPSLVVVLNWFAELERLVPVR
jgi:serine/threonine-protein kinase